MKGTWPVVAIGASAGGIHSLHRVLQALPSDFAGAVLIVLHMDPKHTERSLAMVLRQECKLPLRDAEAGEPLRPGHVYVCRPGRDLTVRGGRIRLTRSAAGVMPRPSVDALFSSVAVEYAERAVAVVLSGSGNDGTLGLLRVKEMEGTTVVEDRTTAEYAAMPESAARTGAVDAELGAERIGEFLDKLARGETPRIQGSQWDELLDVLRKGTNTDFSHYKTSTLHRRLEKRILATGKPDLKAYIQLLKRDPKELERVRASFLIKVSSFFRDRQAWDLLRKRVAKPLARNLPRGQEVRAWSAGCATGEEAYSLAILLLETLPSEAHRGLRVFATDLDEGALEIARQGVYEHAQLADLTPAQRRRFFEPDGKRMKVRKEVRQHVIFGKHDLTRDPPIANLDLLACRNVLIYFNAEQKQAVLSRLSYAVKPGGCVFLGKSEGILEVQDLLEPIVAKARIFRRTETHHLPRQAPRAVEGARSVAREGSELDRALREGERAVRAQEAFHHLLLKSTSVILVTLDQQRRITLWNKAAERFFEVDAAHALGKPFLEVAEGFSADRFHKAVKAALSALEPVELRYVPYRLDPKPPRYLDLEVTPVGSKADRLGEVVITGVNSTARHDAEQRQRELVQEVRKAAVDATRSNENLQSSNEELETLNEELQSSAEEQQTLNEELQSSNEELETTNEELQSSNEELGTLNEELRTRGDELERVGSFLRGLLDSAADGAIVCDSDHRVTFWSKAAKSMLRISDAQAVGRNLFDLVPAFDATDLRKAVREVLTKREVQVVEDVALADGKTLLRLSLSPVNDRAGKSRGYIVLASDVTRRAQREEETQRSRDLLAMYNRLLTHDVNNLASAIGTHLELGREAKDAKETEAHLGAAEGLVAQTSTITRNIQMLNELGTHNRLRGKVVDAAALLQEATRMVTLAYPERPPRISNSVEGPVRVEADPALLQVFFNLLANAVKHHPQRAQLTLTKTRGSLSGREAVAFRLSDDGPGIPPEIQRRAFEEPLTDSTQGRGLGLYVARSLVERWGGSLRVEDRIAGEPEKGSTMVVTLSLPGKGKPEGPSKRKAAGKPPR